ncbi:MAG: hypothetical protein AB7O04_12650 [Hyphomonadaceae bacterium]
MRALKATPAWRAVLALLGVAALALGLAAKSAPLIAAGCVACAAPIFQLRLRLRRRADAERAERERMANFDRQIVAVVRQHAALLERRRAQIATGLDRLGAEQIWDRDLSRFRAKFLESGLAPLRRGETEDEILCRVRLVVDEVLARRARAA